MSRDRLTRRDLLQSLGGVSLAAALPGSRAWAEGAADSLNFLVVGDWGRHGHEHQREVAERMGESAQLLQARFIISVGDNFYDNGVTGVHDPAWKSSFEAVYTASSLQVPWYIALGNHDYRGNAQAQLDYSAISPRWRLPARWYRFSERTPEGALLEVFVLDTSPMIRAYYADGARLVKVADQQAHVPVQLAWLESALHASRADWKIVIGHHPIYMGRTVGALSAGAPDRRLRLDGGSRELIEQLDPILQRHRVALYLNGHIHDLQHVQRGATHYVCTGAGSRTARYCDIGGSDFCSLHPGFVACGLTALRLRVTYRDYRGAGLHVVEIVRPT